MAALIEKNSVWTDKHLYDEAEKNYYENLAKVSFLFDIFSYDSL